MGWADSWGRASGLCPELDEGWGLMVTQVPKPVCLVREKTHGRGAHFAANQLSEKLPPHLCASLFHPGERAGWSKRPFLAKTLLSLAPFENRS